MDKLTCMKTFCQVVKEGNFSSAARKLNLSKVMVSRSISYLEDYLGTRLFQRTTRKMSLTDNGSAYYERCQVLIDEFDALDATMKDSAQSIKGKLRVAVPSEAFTALYLLPFFKNLNDKYPDVTLDIDMSDRHIDLIEEGFDVAVRIGELADSSLIAKKIANVELILCASSSYVNKLKNEDNMITLPQDMLKHAFILDSNYRNGQQIKLNKQNKTTSIKVNSHITVNSAVATSQFIKYGMGIGIVPDFMVKEDIKNQHIVRLIPDWNISKGGIYVVYGNRKHLSEKIRCFVREITHHFDKNVT